jgi:hypothetical protein
LVNAFLSITEFLAGRGVLSGDFLNMNSVDKTASNRRIANPSSLEMPVFFDR